MKVCSSATLFIAATSTILLSGCASMLDSMDAATLGLPDDAPAGYASFLKGQQYLGNRDFSMAKFSFCNSAELGYNKAKSQCAKYSVVNASLRHSNSSSSARFVATSMRTAICDVAQYGEPAKSLCAKIRTMGDTEVINTVHNARKKIMGKGTPVKTPQNPSQNSMTLQIEEF
jgi:hypothetical protein